MKDGDEAGKSVIMSLAAKKPTPKPTPKPAPKSTPKPTPKPTPKHISSTRNYDDTTTPPETTSHVPPSDRTDQLTTTAAPPTTIMDDTKKVDSGTNTTIKDICAANHQAVVASPDNCGQFFNCSSRDHQLGEFLQECDVGKLFHEGAKQCLPSTQVKCRGRYEPRQACDYQRVMLDHVPSGSRDECPKLYPSCDRVTVGHAPTRGKFQTGYVICNHGRAKS